MNTIVIVEYDPNWPPVFEQLRLAIWSAVSDLATSVEHVGSTSVPGLAAKPIIDISVVVPGADEVRVAIDRPAALGYVDRGNLGVDGRGSMPRHHLYLCPSRSSTVSSRSGSPDSKPMTSTRRPRARQTQSFGFSTRPDFRQTNLERLSESTAINPIQECN